MQRVTPDGIVIACDFTGEDWDGETPMIEGHKGAVLSLAALARAIDEAEPAPENFECVLCLRAFDAGEKAWRHPDPPATANPDAVVCWDCLQQADRTFARDKDVEWERRIEPSKRWR